MDKETILKIVNDSLGHQQSINELKEALAKSERTIETMQERISNKDGIIKDLKEVIDLLKPINNKK